MKFSEAVAQTLAWLQREGRVSYRALRLEFDLTEDVLDALKEELIEVKELAVDKDGKILVWKDRLVSSVQSPESKEQGQTPTVQTLDARPRTLDAAAERQQLTVMFCDLVDSTALAARLDPEEWREVVRTYQATCASVIQRYEGHIAQYLGDGLLVYFGYPSAHEDDAQRAARAALGLVEAMQHLSFPTTQLPHPLQVRLGIHTGLVVIGEIGEKGSREQLALGDTPNVAARLQGLAAPDTVVISAATHHLIDGLFECRDLGARSVKGVTTPLQVYQVVGESGMRSRLDAAATRGLTPLVGREEESGLLRKRWEQAKSGEGQVVLLSGEAGIGKSRLVQMLKERVAHEMAVQVEYRCSPYHQNSALYPVIEHLQRLLHFSREDSPKEKLQKLKAALSDRLTVRPSDGLTEVVPLVAALLSLPHPEGAPPITLSPQKQKQKTLEALLAWLVKEAERQPVLVVVEDVHWVDPSTLEFLSLLLEQAPATRLLLVLTFRPDFTPPWAMFSHLTQLTLSRLARRQVEEMVEKVTGGKALPAEVIQQLITKTDGVPLFVEELTKMVVESGLVRESDGHYELTGPLPPLAIPTTLQDSLLARLDRLATVKEVAQLGAMLGREFSYELLHAVSLLDEHTLQHGLTQLVEAELLYQRGQPPHARYVFKHALIQDAAYQSLLKSKRQQYHKQIASVLEERFPEARETQPELLAHHYTEAGLIAQAVPYWQQAGEKAAQSSANAEAISHLTKGLEVLAALPDTSERAHQELALQIILGPALITIKGWTVPEVEKAYTRAQELCQQVGETAQLFPVLFGLWVFHHVRGEHQTARELGEQLLSLAQRVQTPALLLAAHTVLGYTLYCLGEFISSREHIEQGLVLYNPQQHHTLAFLYAGADPGMLCLSQATWTLWVFGHPDQALQRNHQALTLAQKLSHPHSLAFVLGHAAALHQFHRETQAAQERAEAVITLSTEQGFPYWLAWGTILRGWALAEQGRAEEGIAQIRQGLAAYWAPGAELRRPHFFTFLAEAYEKKGQAEEGLTVLAEAQALMNKTGEHYWEAELYRLKGQLTLQSKASLGQVSDKSQASQGKSEDTNPQSPAPNPQAEAEACFLKAIEIARRQQAKSLELRAVMSLARLWQHQGRKEEARTMLTEIYGWFTEGFDTKDLQEAEMLLAELSH